MKKLGSFSLATSFLLCSISCAARITPPNHPFPTRHASVKNATSRLSESPCATLSLNDWSNVFAIGYGEEVIVKLKSAREVRGKLMTATGEHIRIVTITGQEEHIERNDVYKIEWWERDALLNGAWLGAGAGFLIGFLASELANDPHRVAASSGIYAAIGGAAMGALIDNSLKKRVIVYQAP